MKVHSVIMKYIQMHTVCEMQTYGRSMTETACEFDSGNLIANFFRWINVRGKQWCRGLKSGSVSMVFRIKFLLEVVRCYLSSQTFLSLASEKLSTLPSHSGYIYSVFSLKCYCVFFPLKFNTFKLLCSQAKVDLPRNIHTSIFIVHVNQSSYRNKFDPWHATYLP